MEWRVRRLLALGLVGLGLYGAGCSGASPRPASATDLASILEKPTPPPAAARSQMPDPRANPLYIEDSGRPHGARIVAVVNTQAVLEEEIYAAAFPMIASVRSLAERDKLFKEKLEEVIDRELILQDAEMRLGKKADGKFLKDLYKAASDEFNKQWLFRLMRSNGYTNPDKFVKFMKDNGVAVDQIRRQWERNFVAMEYAKGKLEAPITRIGQGEVLEYYQKHPEQFKVDEAVVWQDLFVADDREKHPSREAARKFAESLVARAKRGEDFAKLSKEFDNGDAGLRPNAEGIGKKKGEISPTDLEPTVLALKEGEVGGPIEIATGFHIVRVAKRTSAGQKPFDGKTQRLIRDKLRGETFQKEMKHWVAEMRRHAVIQTAGQ